MEHSYTDDKGRTRWRENDALGEKLKELHDLLVIGGYPPDHAARYPKLAYTISRHPESIIEVHAQGRLRELPGVAKTVEGILAELIETGDCTKAREPSEGYEPPPRSVLTLTAVSGLGAKTVRVLYAEHGIEGLTRCREALASGTLPAIPGLGPKLRERILATK
jgi:DNA polymerase/3'-5' exonuclease PolX